MKKNMKCVACGKLISKKWLAYPEAEGMVICKSCMPEDCDKCNMTHPIDAYKKCRDNLFKIIKKAEKMQSGRFSIKWNILRLIEEEFDRYAFRTISSETKGYGFLEVKEEDRFVKYKKTKK